MTSDKFPKAGELGPEDEALRDDRPGEAGTKPPEGEDSYVAKVARGAGISSVGQGTGRVLGVVTQAVLARTFGTSLFGIYTLCIAIVSAANILSQFGLDNGVVRYVAHYRAREDTARMRGTIIQAVWITFGISLVVAVAIFFGAGFFASAFEEPRLESVLRYFAFGLPFFALMSILVWATQGFQTVTYATYTQQILRPLIYFVFVVGVYLLGASLAGVAVAYAVSMALGVLIGLYYLRKLFPPLLERSVQPKFETRALFAVSLPMSISRVTQYANNWSAVLILGIFQPAAAVGIFQVAFRTATLATLVRFAFNGIFSPIISNLHSRDMTEDLGRLYKDVARWTFTGAFGLFLIIVLLATEILTIFGGEGFTAGWTALILVAGAQLFSTSVGPSPRMLAMTGNQNVVMLATVIGASTGVALCFALVPSYGLLGAAIGASSAIITENTLTVIAVRRRLGFWPYNLNFLKPLAAGLLAAGAAYLFKEFVSLPGLLPTVVVVGGIFSVLFLTLLFLLGLSETDKEFLRTFWDVAKRLLRRGRS
ncbi:MAG: oligosaccharide flippase family protein [Rubrobacteraceae bacterium]